MAVAPPSLGGTAPLSPATNVGAAPAQGDANAGSDPSAQHAANENVGGTPTATTAAAATSAASAAAATAAIAAALGSGWRAALMAGALGEAALARLDRQPMMSLFVSR